MLPLFLITKVSSILRETILLSQKPAVTGQGGQNQDGERTPTPRPALHPTRWRCC
uniref:Uncharacterized protein n=1 Tax=Anguilla anguilla TaxID=7936 RepID=A0A0E9QC65_ANGAN